MRYSQHMRVTARTRAAKQQTRPRTRQKRVKAGRPVELFFGSFSAPVLGVGSRTHPQRHLLYRAEPYELELLIELLPDRSHLMITGQLLDTSQPEIFRRGVKVTLWNFRKSFVTLRTNEWGEFLGQIEDSGELMVSTKIRMREIVISIRNVLDWPA